MRHVASIGFNRFNVTTAVRVLVETRCVHARLRVSQSEDTRSEAVTRWPNSRGTSASGRSFVCIQCLLVLDTHAQPRLPSCLQVRLLEQHSQTSRPPQRAQVYSRCKAPPTCIREPRVQRNGLNGIPCRPCSQHSPCAHALPRTDCVVDNHIGRRRVLCCNPCLDARMHA